MENKFIKVWFPKLILLIMVLGFYPDLHSKTDFSTPVYFVVDNLEYLILSEKDKTVGVSGYKKKMPDVVVPETVEYQEKTYTVTEIIYDSFEFNRVIETIKLPKTIVSIGGRAFIECTLLKEIEIPAATTYIGPIAFSGCESLTSIYIPENVTEIVIDITSSPFNRCTGLTDIIVSENNKVYSSIDGVLYDKQKTTVLLCPKGRREAVTVPEGVEEIGHIAFSDCRTLSAVSLPSTLKIIGDSGFALCRELTEVELPEGLTHLGKYAFIGCKSLEAINIPPLIDTIEFECFTGCGFKSFTIPPTVKTISQNAFQYCVNLESIYIPKEVEMIDKGAFMQCENLTDFVVSEENPFYSSNGPMLFENKTGFHSYPSAKGDVVIQENITEVYALSLGYNDKITSITFPSTTQVIQSAIIIEVHDNFKWIKCLSPVPPTYYGLGFVFDSAYFDNFYCPAYVPAESVELYKQASYWRKCPIYPIEESAVENITASDRTGKYEVFSIDGRCVLTTTDKEKINSLPKGIYIVNGQKVLVK